MIHFDNIPPEVMQAMCTPMHQILAPSAILNHPGTTTGAIYIGSLSAVNDKDLKAHNITHLMQVFDVPCFPLSEKDSFNCYRIEIHNAASVDLLPYLEAVCSYIDRALSGRSVLVHC